MEQTEKKPFLKYTAESLLVFAIELGILIGALLFIPLVIFLPVPLVFITVRRGFIYGFIPLILLTCLIWVVLGATGAVIYIALFAPVVYIVSYVIQKKIRSFEAVVFSVGAFAIGVALMTAYFYFVLHTDAIAFVLKTAENFMNAHKGTGSIFLYMLNFEDIVTGGLKSLNSLFSMPEAEAVKNALLGIKAFLTTAMPVFLAEYTLAGGFLCYTVSRAFLKKKAVAVAPMPDFAHFRLPKGFFTGFVVIAIFIVGVNFLKVPNYEAVFQACFAAYSIVFAVAGLSFLEFLLMRGKMAKGGRIALLAATGILLFYIVAWVGLFDSIFKIKERIERPDEFDGE